MGINASTALWYVSRATGVVALVLLTCVVVLGIMVRRRRALPGLPRYGTWSLHRSLSLFAVAFVAVHVISAIADPYVTIGIAAAVIPFTSRYETLWLGLGAISVDLVIALVVTSLLRARIGRRTWRAIHWLSYAAWPVALAHSFGSSSDLQHGWLMWLGIGCAVAVVAAAAWRLITAVTGRRGGPRPGRPAVAGEHRGNSEVPQMPATAAAAMLRE
ncbi:MAG TPA: ferric reductase-like transmembrane domain-containing protein [Streptosporangiaceae bacterium]|nr:ferric reductase-like transmembrane domain-containing protein [Streptosporangiaceae bacterium]